MAKPEDRRFINFDQARAEKKKEPLVIEICGEKYELPPDLPAAIVFEAQEQEEKAQGDDRKMAVLARKFFYILFGEEKGRYLLYEKRLTMMDVQNLIDEIIAAYAPVDTSKPEEGAAPGENPTAEKTE
jgi:hypothetical protein